MLALYVLLNGIAVMDQLETTEFLKFNQANILDFTIRLAEVNSSSYNPEGLKQVSAILQHEYAKLDCEQIIMPVKNFTAINNRGEAEEIPLGPVLRCWIRPNAPVQVLLVGHMDTVYTKEHKFQRTSQSGGDILHGPGVADMKGGLAIMLWALKAFELLPQSKNLGWEVLITSDEEIGSPGSAEIIEARGKKHNLALVFEPAMDDKGTLAGARKGSGKFTLVLRGKAAHAGRHFDEGLNAICKMAEVVTKINALNGQRAGVTINVGSIHGGEAVNIVPDLCVCHLDVRIPTNNDADWVRNNLQAISEAFNAQTGYKLTVHGAFDRKPKVLDEKMEKLYSIVKSIGHNIGQEIAWQPSGGCCDGNNLAALGVPNIDTLGARGGKIHSEQEYILIPSLVERAQLLTNILVHLSENGLR